MYNGYPSCIFAFLNFMLEATVLICYIIPVLYTSHIGALCCSVGSGVFIIGFKS